MPGPPPLPSTRAVPPPLPNERPGEFDRSAPRQSGRDQLFLPRGDVFGVWIACNSTNVNQIRCDVDTAPGMAVKPRRAGREPEELAAAPRGAQVAALSDVIAEVGWAGACLFNERTGRLIDGHARRKVALSQGTEKVPVLVGSWSRRRAKILATLDPLAAMAEADGAALARLLADVTRSPRRSTPCWKGWREGGSPGGGRAGAGGDDFDATPEATGPTRTAVGDLWVIGGKHRLLVGDCTDAGNVARLMGGEKVGLCFTSPPYAQQRDYGEAAKEKVQDWDALMCGAFAACRWPTTGRCSSTSASSTATASGCRIGTGGLSGCGSRGGGGSGGTCGTRSRPRFARTMGVCRSAMSGYSTSTGSLSSASNGLSASTRAERKGRGQRVASGIVEELHTPGIIKTHKYPDSVVHVQRGEQQLGRIRPVSPGQIPG
jgi:hypothetical protein